MTAALLFWDASALAERYASEPGREVVNWLFDNVEPGEMATTIWGFVETYSLLVRKLNGGLFDGMAFSQAISSLEAEVAYHPDFIQLPVVDDSVLESVDLIRKHNLNSTDAAILKTLVQFIEDQPDGSPTLILIASDKRLARAAEAEGIQTLNPETIAVADLPDWLASLA